MTTLLLLWLSLLLALLHSRVAGIDIRPSSALTATIIINIKHCCDADGGNDDDPPEQSVDVIIYMWLYRRGNGRHGDSVERLIPRPHPHRDEYARVQIHTNNIIYT